MRRCSTALVSAVVLALSACSKQASKPGAAPSPPARAGATTLAPVTGTTATLAVVPMPSTAGVAQITPPASSSEDAHSTTPAQPAGAPQVEISERTEGPFDVNGQAFTFVKHMQRIAGSQSSDDSTV